MLRISELECARKERYPCRQAGQLGFDCLLSQEKFHKSRS
jgi:hypothetical protein